MLPSPFRSRFDGKCLRADCPVGGKIYKGDNIRWAHARGQKAQTWHAECHPDWIAQQAGGAMNVTQFTESSPRRERDCGGLFEQAEEREEREMMVTQPVNTHAVSQAPPRAGGDSYLAGLATALQPYLRLDTPIDADEVRSIIEEALQGAILKTVTTVDVHNYQTHEVTNTGLAHNLFPELLKLCELRDNDGLRGNIWLCGPAGTGKTTAARNVSKALSLSFAFCGAIDNPYGLFGFIDAQGGYRRTAFREIYEHGGVFLFDEIDGSTTGAVLPFNAALANGHCMFPDGLVARHQDCIIIAAANTWGTGGTSEYVGRLKQDATSLDRFYRLDWPIDESLELATCSNQDWAKRVQGLRARAASKGLKVMITPRSTYRGCSMLSQGWDIARVEKIALPAMSADQWNAISQGVN